MSSTLWLGAIIPGVKTSSGPTLSQVVWSDPDGSAGSGQAVISTLYLTNGYKIFPLFSKIALRSFLAVCYISACGMRGVFQISMYRHH